MIVPAPRTTRIIRSAPSDPAGLIERVSSAAWGVAAEVLKKDDRSSVLAGDSPTGPVVVKSMVLDRPKDWLSRALGVTRLMRQWRGAELLARHGFVVARPLVLWRGRDERGRVVESFAMERLAGKTVLQHAADRDLPAEVESAVARWIGEDVARLVRLGFVNRDHKPSNLLLVLGHSPRRHGGTEGERLDQKRGTQAEFMPSPASPRSIPSPCLRDSVVSAFEIAMLDTVGIRRSRSPRDAVARMLFALTVECVGTGVLPRLSMRLRVVRAVAAGLGLPRREVAWLWLDVRERLGRHRDPRPRVDPLG